MQFYLMECGWIRPVVRPYDVLIIKECYLFLHGIVSGCACDDKFWPSEITSCDICVIFLDCYGYDGSVHMMALTTSYDPFC